MKRAEDILQRDVVAYLRAILSPRDYRVAAIPNGGKRSRIEAAIMKATGTLVGMPDLFILGPLGRCWFIEVKAPRGRISKEQVEMREWMILATVPYVEARDLDDVKTALRSWNLMTREAA